MADSVVKLRLDSGEYDSKIKRAAQNVLAFGENCQKAGQSVAKAEKETLDYVRSIGQMETVAKNTKGKINEMTTAFTELSMQYKQLSAQEKQSPFGQALSQSLDQLKTRIGESKAQLTEVNAELGNTSKQSDETGGVLDALAGKFGLNINQAGAFGIALGVTTTAAKVAKDAFFSNEEQLDEWGRVVASSESVYRGFLDAINTGDISGFLTRMDSIVAAARQAYDALDELATYNAFNQVNVARARQAFMDAQNNYREGTGSKEQVRSAGNAMKGELDQRRDLEKKAYSAEIVRLAKERNVNPVDLARVMLGTYGDYKKIKSMPLTGTRTETLTTQYGMPYQRTWAVAANEMERMGSMLRRFNDTELQKLQGLGAQFFNTGFEKGQIGRQVNRILNGRQGGASGGSGGGGGGHSGGGGGGGRTGRGSRQETPEERAAKLVASAEETFAKTIQSNTLRFENGMDNSEDMRKKELSARERLTMAYVDAYNITQNDEYKTAFEDAAKEYRDLADIVKGKREEFEKATEQLAGMSVNPIDGILNQLLGESMEDYAKRKNIDLNTGKGGGKKSDWAEQTSKNIDKYLSPISTISSGLQEMGVKVPEGIERMIAITQGVSTILTGISAILTLIEASTQIAAAASVSNAIIPFARGGVVHAASGIVAGHYFSGDQVPAMLNSGEVVLNRAQAGVIADALGGGGSPVIQIEGRITGEDIELVQRNRNRRTGRGEYITTKMR